jgi:hypothetical protein
MTKYSFLYTWSGMKLNFNNSAGAVGNITFPEILELSPTDAVHFSITKWL